MKIIGLFIVVFAGAGLSKALGFSDMSTMIGVVIGSGSYILMQVKP